MKMCYLHNFLYLFSLRFGSRIIGVVELGIYAYAIYYLLDTFGFLHMLDALIIIGLGTSCLMSFLMILSTLQGHESSGIIFTYLMWGIFMTIFLDVFYCMLYSLQETTLAVCVGLFVSSTIAKSYCMLVVLSFIHTIVNTDSEDTD